MKKLLWLLCVLPIVTKAQKSMLMIAGKTGDFYVVHTAAPKENYYSIGRMYNISPKEIAPYNGLVLEKGLSLNQTIKVPLKEVNFTQATAVAADEAMVPLYHTVSAKESLYQISTTFNKVALANLRAWNGLKDDKITPGKNIVVGFLKVKQANLVFDTKLDNDVAVVEKPNAIEKPVKKPKAEVPDEEVPKPSTPVVVTKPIEKPVEVKAPVQNNAQAISGGDFKGGIFKANYAPNGNEETGLVGVFKSTSGWDDGKYYCLHNNAPQGTIVKITNKATNKVVYAKVLDVMPDLKQNKDYIIRLSNAAAEALGANNSSFECVVNY
ncbi:LysM peptidoglycan-binding domain-containing protein [Ferruginibacter yonginensis]|uniref:LysM peptidoglycan-binding domain-containing protein n=1 Tax=Ferruginibacter yonginensis TaxID=1310416 RepID=A0ABV8QU28_9BACT